jgi:hypothetical protein
MKLNRQLVDRTLDWLLNVYDEVEDPIGDLAETIGDPVKAQQIFDNMQKLANENPARFLKLFGPEFGDVTARAFVIEQLSA